MYRLTIRVVILVILAALVSSNAFAQNQRAQLPLDQASRVLVRIQKIHRKTRRVEATTQGVILDKDKIVAPISSIGTQSTLPQEYEFRGTCQEKEFELVLLEGHAQAGFALLGIPKNVMLRVPNLLEIKERPSMKNQDVILIFFPGGKTEHKYQTERVQAKIGLHPPIDQPEHWSIPAIPYNPWIPGAAIFTLDGSFVGIVTGKDNVKGSIVMLPFFRVPLGPPA